MASLKRIFAACRVETDKLHKLFVFILEGAWVGHKLDVAAKKTDGIHHFDFLALLPFDVLFGVSKPRPHGSR